MVPANSQLSRLDDSQMLIMFDDFESELKKDYPRVVAEVNRGDRSLVLMLIDDGVISVNNIAFGLNMSAKLGYEHFISELKNHLLSQVAHQNKGINLDPFVKAVSSHIKEILDRAPDPPKTLVMRQTYRYEFEVFCRLLVSTPHQAYAGTVSGKLKHQIENVRALSHDQDKKYSIDGFLTFKAIAISKSKAVEKEKLLLSVPAEVLERRAADNFLARLQEMDKKRIK